MYAMGLLGDNPRVCAGAPNCVYTGSVPLAPIVTHSGGLAGSLQLEERPARDFPCMKHTRAPESS